MTQASVRASLAREEAATLISEDEENNEISSVKSMPVTRVTSGQNVKSKVTEKNKNSNAKSAKSSNKSSSSSASRVTAKLDDLSRLEGKLSGQIEDRFSSLDGKFDRLFGLISSS